MASIAILALCFIFVSRSRDVHCPAPMLSNIEISGGDQVLGTMAAVTWYLLRLRRRSDEIARAVPDQHTVLDPLPGFQHARRTEHSASQLEPPVNTRLLALTEHEAEKQETADGGSRPDAGVRKD